MFQAEPMKFFDIFWRFGRSILAHQVTIDGFNKYIAGLKEAEVPSYFKLIMFNSHEGIRSMTRFLEVSAVPGLSRISYRHHTRPTGRMSNHGSAKTRVS